MTTRTKLILDACLLLATVAHAETWYVDSSISASGNGSSWATAWKGVSNISGVQAGDTVYISGGPSGSSQTYNISNWSPIGGSSGNPVTYQIGQDSAHNGTAIFSGSGTFVNGSLNNLAIVGDAGDGQRHFQANGFTSLIGGTVSNFRLGYVNFGQVSNPNNAMQIASASGFEFDHNYVYLTSPAGNAFAYIIFSGTTWDQNLIHDNTVYLPYTPGNGGYDGIETGGSVGFSIYNNRFIGYAIANYTGGQHPDGWQDTGGSSYIKIYNNTYINFANYCLYGDATFGGFSHLRIYNNLILRTDPSIAGTADGIIIGVDGGFTGGTATFNDIVIANNLIDGFSGNPAIALNNVSSHPATFTSDLIANNVLVNSSYVDVVGNSTTTTLDNPSLTTSQAQQDFVGYTANTGVDANGNPLNNYHLTAAATSLIGQGANESSYFTTDRDGNARSASGAWDIGPYQYGTNAVVIVTNVPPVVTNQPPVKDTNVYVFTTNVLYDRHFNVQGTTTLGTNWMNSGFSLTIRDQFGRIGGPPTYFVRMLNTSNIAYSTNIVVETNPPPDTLSNAMMQSFNAAMKLTPK